MLSVHRGHSTRYLTDEVAKAREGYYTGAVAAGEPPGLWWGAGAEALGLSGEVDADLMEAVYTRLLDPRDPAAHDRKTWDEAAMLSPGHRKYKTAEEIYAGLLEQHPDAGPAQRAELRAQAGRSARQPVAFIDVTVSPPKSVTVAGLAFERAATEARERGDTDAAQAWDAHAQAVEDALMAGARAALEYLQEHAGYAREGHHGGGAGRWIDAPAFVVAQFLQHDSRERDPQWHIHQAILNRVLCADGVWRALDGKLIDLHKPAAAALCERVIEAHLAQSVGLRSETRPDGKAREVIGVDQELMDLFSSRRAQITPKAAALIREFEAHNGRPPSPYERVVIHEQATLVTRRAKSHDGETRTEQFARWEEMARTRVQTGLAEVAEAILARNRDVGPVAEFSPLDVIERAVESLGAARAHYTRADMFKAVSDALPGHLGLAPDEVLPFLDGMTDAAMDRIQRLTPAEDTHDLPDELRLANGAPVYARPGSARYATPGGLAAEKAVRASLVERGAPTLTRGQVDAAIARFAESGITLGPDQEAALRGVLTSGAWVETIVAAAGTGKSFVVGAIADAWANPPTTTGGTNDPSGGQESPGGRVFGLAPYQNAAEVLAGEGLRTKNVAAWLATQARLDRTRPGQTATGPNGDDETWRLRPGDLVVLDEAGTAETPAIREVQQRCRAAGVKLVPVGDPGQLSTIGPGGALADMAEHGICYQLCEVRRFTHAWEGPASLRLRDGDTSVLAEYAKRGRIIDGGTAEQAETLASRAWLADTLNGRESLLMVATNDAAARVSNQLRAELIQLGRVQEDGVPLGEGPELAAWRGTVAGVGDLIQARALAWHLRGFEGNTTAPITRKTYRVIATRADGGLTVAPILDRAQPGAEVDAENGAVERNEWGEQLGPVMALPGSYVRNHVSLGYASTKDAAQGRNVDTGHNVAGAGVDRAGHYVMSTRGRDANTTYVVTRHLAPDADTGETFDSDARTPEAVLADILTVDNDGDRSALAEQEVAEELAASTMTQIDRMADVIREVNAGRLAATLDRLAADGHLSGHDRARIAADDAFGTVERLLRTAELAGHDPAKVLTAAVTMRGLDDATSPAQVLHHRIATRLTGRLTPRVRTGAADLIPHHLRTDPADIDAAGAGLSPRDAQRGALLRRYAEAADERRNELGARTAAQPPAWAIDALGPVPAGDDAASVVARQEWEHRAGWAAAYRELVGHTDDHDPLGTIPGGARVEHRMMYRAAHDALALPEAGDEEAGMTDGRLRARIAGYERERAWAPRWVEDDLAAAHERRQRLDADATMWDARAAAPDTAPDDAAQLRADAARARADAAQLAEQIGDLETADAAWAQWYAHTAVTRDHAERSRHELRARGVDIANPPDRTTPAEWLDAHRAAQTNDEQHAAVTEDDIRDDPDQRRQVDELREEQADHLDDDRAGPAVVNEAAETGVPDIRETAEPDPTERADPTVRRRVRTLEETTQSVVRAQEALTEIAVRRAAEARAAAEAHATAEEEVGRRDELNRWDADGDVVETAEQHDEPAMER